MADDIRGVEFLQDAASLDVGTASGLVAEGAEYMEKHDEVGGQDDDFALSDTCIYPDQPQPPVLHACFMHLTLPIPHPP